MSYYTLIKKATVSARDYHRDSVYWWEVARKLKDCKKNPYILESVEHVIKDAFGESKYAGLMSQRIEREQEIEKADFDRISRDCTIQGHHWINDYGGGKHCSNCALDFS